MLVYLFLVMDTFQRFNTLKFSFTAYRQIKIIWVIIWTANLMVKPHGQIDCLQ